MKPLIVLLLLLPLSFANGHSGRTDSSGGHNDRKNGGYHYHNSGKASPPASPSYTVPKPPPAYTARPAAAPVAKPPAAPAKSVSFTENQWQVAFNNKVARGKLEVASGGGRVDIVNDSHAIEVDKVSKWKQGLAQAERYAEATGKKAGLALYIDGETDGFEIFKEAKETCEDRGITVWLINSHVSVNDLVALSAPEAQKAKKLTAVDGTHWINSSSSVRHNRSCRWFGNTTSGRMGGSDEGRACGTCGG